MQLRSARVSAAQPQAALGALLVLLLFAAAGWLPRAAEAAPFPVTPTVETAPMHSSGDSADDAAIWLNPADRSLSTIIGTDKRETGGLVTYDLAGRELHFYADGRLNNVDVHYNVPLGLQKIDLVAATNRVNRTIDFYRANPDRTLTRLGTAPVSSAIDTPRGICLYHSPVSGKYYAFVTDIGKTDQYELDGSSGSITARIVRQWTNTPTHTEGLVADDERGVVYLAVEDVGGIFRYGAEPTDSTTPVKVDGTTDTGGHIIQDVKGLAMYFASGGGGYLLAVSQGGSTFHVYDRAYAAGAANPWRGEFKVVASPTIDAVTGMDGLDVTNVNLGSSFPNGLFVTQDDVNPGANKNFKVVPWQSIANAFTPGLTVDPLFDPRSVGAGGSSPPPPPDDTTPPNTVIDSGPSGTVTSTAASFAFHSTETGSTFSCTLDGTAVACTSPKSYANLTPGDHTFTVAATDASGNADQSPASQAWTVAAPTDTTPPDTVIDSGPSGTITSTAASFAFHSTETGSTFSCTLDGVAAGCTSPKDYAALAPGGHTFTVAATDSSGNADQSSASRTWTVSSGGGGGTPVTTSFPATADAYVTDATPASNFASATALGSDTSPQERSYFRFDVSGLSGTVTSAKLRAWVTNGSTNGPAIYATDGLWSELGLTWNNKPAPQGTASQDKASVPAGAWVEYDVTPLVGGNGSFNFVTVGTSSDGTQVSSRESANKPSLVVTAGGGTPPPPPPGDTTPPDTLIDGGPSGTVTSTSASFTFHSTETGSSFECKLDGASFAPCSSPQSYSGLTATSHTFQVRATDSSTNQDATPATRTWTVATAGGGGTPTTVSVPAAADAYVAAATPGSNFGAVTALVSDSSPQTQSYYRFDVSGVTGTITGAKLRLWAADGTANGPAVYLTGSSWTETGLTWTNKPAQQGTASDDKAAITKSTWVEFNVTPLVGGNGTYSFVTIPTSSDGFDAGSRESANKPTLVLTVAP